LTPAWLAAISVRPVESGAETERERTTRRRQRTLFDGVAELYQASRLGYPSDLVEFAVATAAVGTGSDVLEVGCGTGQLTERLVSYRFRLTAIDIGPSMIAAARRRTGDPAVSFQVSSFEDFAAADASFDLIISGTAFHWIDPEVRFAKSARLLRPGGWLALLATGEDYAGPFGAALRDMWVTRSDDGGARARPRQHAATEIAGTGLFETPVCRTHAHRMSRPVEAVVAVENTRATSLSWPASVRQEFTAELRRRLESQTEVELTQHTALTMARVAPGEPGLPHLSQERREPQRELQPQNSTAAEGRLLLPRTTRNDTGGASAAYRGAANCPPVLLAPAPPRSGPTETHLP
jgi:ubiquinone/menaquinone biosynthesis C-methylase UbiE